MGGTLSFLLSRFYSGKLGVFFAGLLFAYEEHEAYMSEIQFCRIVNKMAMESSEQGTDGDEVMVKDVKNL